MPSGSLKHIGTFVKSQVARRCRLSFAKSVTAAFLTVGLSAWAQDPPKDKPRFDVYGFAMLDTGYQFNQNDPNWFDVVRPTKLPSFKDEFGGDGHWFAGVR